MTLWLQNQAGQKRKSNKFLQILKNSLMGVKNGGLICLQWPFCKHIVHVIKERDERRKGLPVSGMPASLISRLDFFRSCSILPQV